MGRLWVAATGALLANRAERDRALVLALSARPVLERFQAPLQAARLARFAAAEL
jgi:hypothetical protein